MACCGQLSLGTVPPTVWPSDNYQGTDEPLAGLTYNQVDWEGEHDASIVFAGSPSWFPAFQPTRNTITRIRGEKPPTPVGFPSACFPTPPDPHFRTDPTQPTNWHWMSSVLAKTYTDPFTALFEMQLYVPTMERAFVEENDETVVPGFVFASTNEWNILFVSGTSNSDQWIWHALSGTIGLGEEEGYATLGGFQVAAESVMARIRRSGLAIREKWVIAGHSYGGAIATLIAAKMRQRYLNREVRLFTIGCPIPGDARLQDRIAGCAQAHVQNEGDVIPLIPPPGREQRFFLFLANPLWFNLFRSFEPFRNRYLLKSDGSYIANGDTFGSIFPVTTVLATIFGGGIPGAIEHHDAETYAARAALIEG